MLGKSMGKTIGSNIRRFRTEQGISQEELAASVFVTRQTVSNYETGRSQPDLDMLQRIAQVLHVELVWLLYGKPEPPRRERGWVLAVQGGSVCALLLSTWLLLGWTGKMMKRAYAAAPYLLVRLALVPGSMLCLGAFLARWIHVEQLDKSGVRKVGRGVLMGFLAVYAAAMIPYWIWCLAILVQILSGAGSISAILPRIPVYGDIQMGLIHLSYHWPLAYVLLGAALRLFFQPAGSGKLGKKP